MNRLALIFVAVGALAAQAALAAPAQVGSWTRGCQTGQTITSLVGASVACYTPAASASLESASPILYVGNCENIDVFMWDDYDGDGTACTVTWTIDGCPPGTDRLSNDSAKNAACNTLQGAASLSGDDVESNLAAVYVRVHGENAGANIDSCRIEVKCALEASK